MRCLGIMVMLGAMALGCTWARGEEPWSPRHAGSGSGWAHVFDGGRSEYYSTATTIAATMHSGASDQVMLPHGASYLTNGISDVQMDQERLEIRVSMDTGYYADSHIGADRPGGEGGGQVSSIFEFLMPAEDLDWYYDLRITENRYFTGSTLVVVENLSQSMRLLELSSEIRNETTTLIGDMGDVIRITTEMSGKGSVPDEVMGSYRYASTLRMTFTVPEPGTLWLLALGTLMLGRR